MSQEWYICFFYKLVTMTATAPAPAASRTLAWKVVWDALDFDAWAPELAAADEFPDGAAPEAVLLALVTAEGNKDAELWAPEAVELLSSLRLQTMLPVLRELGFSIRTMITHWYWVYDTANVAMAPYKWLEHAVYSPRAACIGYYFWRMRASIPRFYQYSKVINEAINLPPK